MANALNTAGRVALVALALVAAGCSVPRSFPSASGNNGLSADGPPLPQVITSAVKYAHQQIAPASPLVVNLPAEVNTAAWAAYERMYAPGKSMCPGDTGVWTVRQARIDGSIAQVDIEYPTRDGFYQLVTVHMTNASAGVGYKPEYLQYYRIPVKDPVCNTPVEVVERNCGVKAATAGGSNAGNGRTATTPAASANGAATPVKPATTAAPTARPAASPAPKASPTTPPQTEDPNK